jgi:hypothetical protein
LGNIENKTGEIMKKLINLIFLFLAVTLLGGDLLAQKSTLGSLNIQLNDQKKENFTVQQALLYRKVVLDYDSTVLIQGGDSSRILFSPQFGSGENHVLRIIAGTLSDQNRDFYDILVVLGDTLCDTITWKGDSSLVFISVEGLLQPQRARSKNITGQVIFNRDKKNNIQSGILWLEFDIPNLFFLAKTNHFILDGKFELAVGDYRYISIGKIETDLKEKERRRQNIYWALILSAFLLAIFGLR